MAAKPKSMVEAIISRAKKASLEPGLGALVVDERAVLSVARGQHRGSVPLQAGQLRVDGVDGVTDEGVDVQGPGLGLAHSLELAGLLLDVEVVHGALHHIQTIVDSVGEVAQEGDVVVGARAAGEDGAKDQGSDHVEGKQDQDDGADGAQADRAAVQQAGHVHDVGLSLGEGPGVGGGGGGQAHQADNQHGAKHL